MTRRLFLVCQMIVSAATQSSLGGPLALAIMIGWTVAPPVSAGTITIAQTDAAAPEGNGDLNSFDSVVLNDAGQVAFRAGLKNTSGGLDDSLGIYLHNGTTLQNVARKNNAAPEGNGDFNFFEHPILNDAGQVAFRGILKNTSGGSSDDEGIYLHNGTTLQNLARENDPVPEGNGNFDRLNFAQPVLNDAGQVAFNSSLKNTGGGPTGNRGLYLHNGTTLQNLARKNNPVPEGNGDFDTFSSHALNSAGQVAFTSSLKNTGGGSIDNSGLYLHNGTALQNLVRENEVVPGGNGVFNGFSGVVLNDAVQVAFYAGLRDNINGPADRGIYLHNGGSLKEIARNTEVVPGGNGNFHSFNQLVLNSAGQTAFEALLYNTSGGGDDSEGIYLHDGTVLKELARTNNAVPEGNGDFAEFVFANTSINGGGQLAFFALLKNTIGGSADNEGVYLTDGIEKFKVVRKGDLLNGKTVSSLTFDSGSGGEDGRRSALNDLGQVAYGASFTDGSFGVFLYTPEELHFRGTSSGLWDSKSNWTLSINPAHVHTVNVDASVAAVIDGPSSATTVAALNVHSTGTVGFSELRLKPGGPLTVTNGTTIGNRGRLSGSGQINGEVSVEAGGEIVALSGDSITFDSAVTNDGQINVINGTLTFPGDGVSNTDGLTNNGTMNLINATINGDVFSPTGSTINVASGVVFNGLVSGAGDFPGAGLVTFNGGYAPGDSPAVVEFASSVSLSSSNTLNIELGGLLDGDFDQLDIAGDATLDGLLAVELIPGYIPQRGDTFLIMDIAGTRTGQFQGLDEGDLFVSSSGYQFQISYAGGDGNDVLLTAAAPVPEPGSYLTLLGLLGIFARRRRMKR